MTITEWPIQALVFKLDGLLHLGTALVIVELEYTGFWLDGGFLIYALYKNEHHN